MENNCFFYLIEKKWVVVEPNNATLQTRFSKVIGAQTGGVTETISFDGLFKQEKGAYESKTDSI